MPDISMCNGKGCEFKDSCYRYTAEPNEWRQTYFSEAPYKVINGEQRCKYYWEDKSKKEKKC